MTFDPRRFVQEDDGATAVEFALVLPLLLAIVFGIICFGQYFAIANSLQQLAAEAARHSVLELGATQRAALAESFIDDAGERFTFLGNDKVTRSVQTFSAPVPGIQVTLTYDLQGSAVDIMDGFLGFDIESISRSSYLAY